MSLLTTAITCLALNVYKEARGEPRAGQLAVAKVTLNRAKKRRKTVCQIVTAKNQFSWTRSDLENGKLKPSAIPDLNSKAWANSIYVANKALTAPDATRGATFFHTTSIRPYWVKHVSFTLELGNHRFYRENI